MAQHLISRPAPLILMPPAMVVHHRPVVFMSPMPMPTAMPIPMPMVLRRRPPTVPSSASTIQIRSVWAHNLVEEFDLIRSLLRGRFRFVSIDTEFPGTIHRSEKPHYVLTSEERYSLLKSNVDDLHLIQLGLTLSDADGAVGSVWQFNFRDFDIHADGYAPESIDLLRSQGFDFEALRADGIDSRDFAELMFQSGLASGDLGIHWITFSGEYDFAYMVKMLVAEQPLPSKLEDFLELVEVFFGGKVFDVKEIAKDCADIRGGLERVATALGVSRETGTGTAHQAGSDSLLTCRAFLRLWGTHLAQDASFSSNNTQKK